MTKMNTNRQDMRMRALGIAKTSRARAFQLAVGVGGDNATRAAIIYSIGADADVRPQELEAETSRAATPSSPAIAPATDQVAGQIENGIGGEKQ